MKALPLLSPVLALGACAAPGPVVPTDADRMAAEQFVAASLATQFPNYPSPDMAASCVQRHATDREILLLAGEVGTARAQQRRTLGVTVAQRPETQACFAEANLPRLR